MDDGPVATEREGRVATIRLRNPPDHLMTPRMLRHLDRAVAELVADRSVRAVVITGGHPGVFIRHVDPGGIARSAAAAGPPLPYAAARAASSAVAALSRLPGAERVLDRSRLAGMMDLLRLDRICRRMNASDKVFVAAVDGIAFGGSFILAMACDLRLLADGEHRIGVPEVTLGFVPPTAAQRTVLSIGQAKTLELALTGGMVSPEEAARLGLVHKVVPPERLADEARVLAERAARHAPAMVRELKRAVYSTSRLAARRGLASENAGFAAAVSHRASQEALLALERALREERAHGDERDVLAAWERLAGGTGSY